MHAVRISVEIVIEQSLRVSHRTHLPDCGFGHHRITHCHRGHRTDLVPRASILNMDTSSLTDIPVGGPCPAGCHARPPQAKKRFLRNPLGVGDLVVLLQCWCRAWLRPANHVGEPLGDVDCVARRGITERLRTQLQNQQCTMFYRRLVGPFLSIWP